MIKMIQDGAPLDFIKEAIMKYPGHLDDPVDDKGSTLVIVAVFNGRVEVAEQLLIRKANINKADNDGNTALHHACHQNFKQCIELLITAGADESI